MKTEREVPERCEPAPTPPFVYAISAGLFGVLIVATLLLGWYFETKWGGGGSPYKFAFIQVLIGATIAAISTVIPNLHEACHKYAFRWLGYENAESYNWNVLVPFGGPPHAVATGQHIAKKHWPVIELAPLVVGTVFLGGSILAIELFLIPIVDPMFSTNVDFLFHSYTVFAIAVIVNIGPSWGDIYQTYYFYIEYDADATAYFTDTTIDEIRIPRTGWEIELPFGKELHGFNGYYCPPDPDRTEQ
jgi:hypothetical protein